MVRLMDEVSQTSESVHFLAMFAIINGSEVLIAVGVSVESECSHFPNDGVNRP